MSQNLNKCFILFFCKTVKLMKLRMGQSLFNRLEDMENRNAMTKVEVKLKDLCVQTAGRPGILTEYKEW